MQSIDPFGKQLAQRDTSMRMKKSRDLFLIREFTMKIISQLYFCHGEIMPPGGGEPLHSRSF